MLEPPLASPMEPRPPQPREQDWAFVRDLAERPYHQPLRWTPRAAGPDEVSFSDGMRLVQVLPDPKGRLDTAVADFRRFLTAAGLSANGSYALRVEADARLERESFRLLVESTGARLQASDTEGVRRGLVWVEDEMQRRGGPFLPRGRHGCRYWVRTRLSRCFYGPVNRPPRSRDELADDVDYYPEPYLDRLAHEGVNGLWFTVSFFRTVPSEIIPEYGRQAGPRLDKLRRTVAKCWRYGIRIYPFCIEPAGFGWPYPELAAARAAHPDLVGHGGAFCTSTEKGQAYLYEATHTLFSEVPDLGGLIVIPVGERQTHCYSGRIPYEDGGCTGAGADAGTGGPAGGLISCPRCAPRQPWEVLAATLAGLREGMQAAAPEAELVAWPYGQFVCWGAARTVQAAAHMPEGIILQHNFETGGHKRQLGRDRPTWDYWLSYVGPSALFERSAQAALGSHAGCGRAAAEAWVWRTACGRNEVVVGKTGGNAEGQIAPGAANGALAISAEEPERRAPVRLSAKLQVSCSHEVATAQVVPAPGLLYRKYRAMRRLGVSSAMQSWYFGAYPSLMTRAAGELSRAPFPRSERAFLRQLAARDWGEHADTVARAWAWFARAYGHYPTAHVFGYYGPMHDGPVWPLYLIPRRLPLAPTWQIGYPPSGDYIAECITNGFTLTEVVTLCRRMADQWQEGVRLLEAIRPDWRADEARTADIDIAAALGLQFRSGYQILRFYALREQLAVAHQAERRRTLLAQMETLVRAEMTVDDELLPLTRRNSCLGFHSEAEGYKYYPELIEWRQRQLARLLDTEFPAVAARVSQAGPLFPRYTGAVAQDWAAGRQARCGPEDGGAALEPRGGGGAAGALLEGAGALDDATGGARRNGATAFLEAVPVGPVARCMRLPRVPETGWNTVFDRTDMPPHRPGATGTGARGRRLRTEDWQQCTHWLLQRFDQQRWERCAYDRHAFHPVAVSERQGRTTRWRAALDDDAVYLQIQSRASDAAIASAAKAPSPSSASGVDGTIDAFAGEQLQVLLEPVRTQPRLILSLGPGGTARCVHDDGYIPQPAEPWESRSVVEDGCWTILLRLPLEWLRAARQRRWQPLRLNVVRSMPIPGQDGTAHCSWAPQQPVQGRLVWGTLNPATDYGWLVLRV